MKYSINKAKNKVSIILDSSFDVSHYEQFKAICNEHNQADVGFSIDFRKTEYLDSSALGMLLLLREQTEGDKSRVTLENVGESALKILKIAHFHQLFNIHSA
jgi:anti-anti-sigma factor